MSSSKNLEYAKTAFLSKSNSAFIEEMYLKFVNNDPDLPNGWREYFSDIGEEFEVVVNEINEVIDISARRLRTSATPTPFLLTQAPHLF